MFCLIFVQMDISFIHGKRENMTPREIVEKMLELYSLDFNLLAQARASARIQWSHIEDETDFKAILLNRIANNLFDLLLDFDKI